MLLLQCRHKLLLLLLKCLPCRYWCHEVFQASDGVKTTILLLMKCRWLPCMFCGVNICYDMDMEQLPFMLLVLIWCLPYIWRIEDAFSCCWIEVDSCQAIDLVQMPLIRADALILIISCKLLKCFRCGADAFHGVDILKRFVQRLIEFRFLSCHLFIVDIAKDEC